MNGSIARNVLVLSVVQSLIRMGDLCPTCHIGTQPIDEFLASCKRCLTVVQRRPFEPERIEPLAPTSAPITLRREAIAALAAEMQLDTADLTAAFDRLSDWRSPPLQEVAAD